MINEEIIEGNKLVAEFMGFRPVVEDVSSNIYDASWDWLMPVVEKIDNTATFYTKQFAGLQIFELGLTAEIETVWLAVVEFIKWYNQQELLNKESQVQIVVSGSNEGKPAAPDFFKTPII